MRILVTAFEPFGGESENASLEAVRRLAAAWAADPRPVAELVTGTLPVAFGAAGAALRALVDEHRPDAVLAVGEAGGRGAITPERWAANEDDARIPDNAGAQPRPTAIDPAGPARRALRLDVDALVSAILAVGLPAAASDDAGRFLCNHVAYLVAGLDVPGGFVHVPAVRSSGTAGVGDETDPGAAAGASVITHEGRRLAFDDLALGLAAAVRAIARSGAREPERAPTPPRVDRAGTVVASTPEAVYAALLDAEALIAWLPPRDGSAAAHVDFVELVPRELVVQRVAFGTAGGRSAREVLMTWRMQPVSAGTRVTVAATDVPPHVSSADHEPALGRSLAQLAALLER